jgi:hypothetical protein
MEDLIQPYPCIKLETNDVTKQRSITCARPIKEKELIFRSLLAGCTIHRKHYKLMCFYCKKFHEDTDMVLPFKCKLCKITYYCSKECMTKDLLYHVPHCHFLPIIDKDKNLKKEETSFVLLLLRLLSKLSIAEKKQLHVNEPTVTNITTNTVSEDENNNKSGKTTIIDNDADNALIRLQHVLMMMKDHKNVNGFKRRTKQREKASSYFVQLMHSNRVLKNSNQNQHQQQYKQVLTIDEQLTLLPQFLDTKVCCDILASGPLNEFAMFDADGEAVGCGFFPLAAMCNHSCLPTASVQIEGEYMSFYATRNINVGEEITQSYANLGDDGRLTRQENIQVSWGFKCTCLRCKIEKELALNENLVGGLSVLDDPILLENKEDDDDNIKQLKHHINSIKSFDEANKCECGAVAVPVSKRGKRKDDACFCNSFNLIGSV